MNGPVSETQWYIARDGKQHGPLTDVEMRTFVSHNYLRPTDLIWRPGMAEWQPAPTVFPAVFQQADGFPGDAPQAPQTAGHAPQQHSAPQQATVSYGAAAAGHASPYDTQHADGHDESDDGDEDAAPRSTGKRLAIAAAILAVLGGGAFALAKYQEPLMALVSGSKPAADAPTVTAEASTDATPPPAAPETEKTAEAAAPSASAETQTAALAPPAPPAPPPPVDGSEIDSRLQKIPVWALLKQNYHDWYETTVGEAVQMEADKRPESDVSMHLAQGLVTLRRQNAEKALEASPARLREMASAFLANLQALQAQGVSACYGFISKGETSPAIVQLMQDPDKATAFNAHVKAIFEAIDEGTKSPSSHAPAVKEDYDALIKELGKIGWKEDDLKTFSNPRLLAKRPPDQVCKMVIDWFVAHLAVKDEAVQERLLYETLKPVVTG